MIQSRTRSSASSCVSPASSPASSFIRPSGPITDGSGSPWSRPISKSSGSCAGVTFRAPVPNSMSTRSSAITGTARSTNGTSTSRPIASRQRSSSGFTATATSARIVAGRAVAIVTPPSGSSANG